MIPEKPSLLLVDDDPLIVDSLAMVLESDFHLVTASTREQAKTECQNLSQIPDLALIDLGLPPEPHTPDQGFNLIKELLGLNRHIKTLVLSGQDDMQNIQHALTLGAVDFIAKPCDLKLLQTRLKHQMMILNAEATAEQENRQPILGESQEINTLKVLIEQFAKQPFPVLIDGESGSGKELVAEQLHQLSNNQHQPFLTLNCAAFNSELLESQLFGHQKGAFTGATENKTGFFEEADSGSLFLDEIGEMPLELQSKLLRVLENHEFYRLGETQVRTTNARIIAATNRDLQEEVRQGRFRKDLFHRLSVLTINVPPLRQRGSDCLLLLQHFQALYSAGTNPFHLKQDALELLTSYEFPGNVRELRNIVIRLVAKYPGQEIGQTELRQELELDPIATDQLASYDDKALEKELMTDHFNLDSTLEQWEKRYIRLALDKADGNLSHAARLLGINRTTLYSRLQKLTLEEQ